MEGVVNDYGGGERLGARGTLFDTMPLEQTTTLHIINISLMICIAPTFLKYTNASPSARSMGLQFGVGVVWYEREGGERERESLRIRLG